MYRITFLLILSFFLLPSAQAQTADEAMEQIRQLKKSFILIRLQTAERKINALKERGLNDQAEEVANEQYQENREIILSFTQTFEFCPVYFFYAEQSENIREGQLTGHVFNAKNEMVDKSKLSERPFFTAEFAETPTLGISGFILMDQYMVPLESPFPYYERTYIFFSLIKQSKARIAERYNAKLQAFYDRYY